MKKQKILRVVLALLVLIIAVAAIVVYVQSKQDEPDNDDIQQLAPVVESPKSVEPAKVTKNACNLLDEAEAKKLLNVDSVTKGNQQESFVSLDKVESICAFESGNNKVEITVVEYSMQSDADKVTVSASGDRMQTKRGSYIFTAIATKDGIFQQKLAQELIDGVIKKAGL